MMEVFIKGRIFFVFLGALMALCGLTSASGFASLSATDLAKKVPPQSADAFQKLRFLVGTWHCIAYGSDPSMEHLREDVTYTLLPGDNWLREDTLQSASGKQPASFLHTVLIGRDDLFRGGPTYYSDPFLVYETGDITYAQDFAGWVNGVFKIYRKYGDDVSLARTGSNSIEWRTRPPIPEKGIRVAYYPDALRTCHR